MSVWTDFVKAFAKKHNVSYGCALSMPECSKEYREHRPQKLNKKEKREVAGMEAEENTGATNKVLRKKAEHKKRIVALKSKLNKNLAQTELIEKYKPYAETKAMRGEDKDAPNITFHIEELPTKKKRGRKQKYATKEEALKAKQEQTKASNKKRYAEKKQKKGTGEKEDRLARARERIAQQSENLLMSEEDRNAPGLPVAQPVPVAKPAGKRGRPAGVKNKETAEKKPRKPRAKTAEQEAVAKLMAETGKSKRQLGLRPSDRKQYTQQAQKPHIFYLPDGRVEYNGKTYNRKEFDEKILPEIEAPTHKTSKKRFTQFYDVKVAHPEKETEQFKEIPNPAFQKPESEVDRLLGDKRRWGYFEDYTKEPTLIEFKDFLFTRDVWNREMNTNTKRQKFLAKLNKHAREKAKEEAFKTGELTLTEPQYVRYDKNWGKQKEVRQIKPKVAKKQVPKIELPAPPAELQLFNIKSEKEYKDDIKKIQAVKRDKSLTEEQKRKVQVLEDAVKKAWDNWSGLYKKHLGDVNAWIADPKTNKQMADDYIEYMTQDFYHNHPDWIQEVELIKHTEDGTPYSATNNLGNIYTHRWDSDDLLIDWNFVLQKHYLYGGIDPLPQDLRDAGDIFWDATYDDFPKKIIYKYAKHSDDNELDGVIDEMYDAKFNKLPRSKIPAQYLKYYSSDDDSDKGSDSESDEEGAGFISNSYKKVASFGKSVVGKVEKFADKVIHGRKEFSPKVQRILAEYGDQVIRKITINRTPVGAVLIGALSVVSGGDFLRRFKKEPYDKLFHLRLDLQTDKGVVDLEKNEVINMDIRPSIAKDAEIKVIHNVPPDRTINELLDIARSKVSADKFFKYSAKDNNCQDFIMMVLTANQIGTPDDYAFIKQEASQLFGDTTWLRKVSNTLTDLGASVDVIRQGGAIKKKVMDCGGNLVDIPDPAEEDATDDGEIPEKYLSAYGIDFEDLKKGAFTRQLKDFNRKHKKKLTMEQFAHYVIDRNEEFNSKTHKRAMFYLNVLAKHKN